MTRRLVCLVCLLAVLGSWAGCAIVEKENRRTLNALDKAVQIESTGGRIAAAPVFIPVGVAAALADMVIVHPIASVPKAADDTSEDIWEDPTSSPFWEMMLFVPKVIVTPLYFTGAWVLRVLFPI